MKIPQKKGVRSGAGWGGQDGWGWGSGRGVGLGGGVMVDLNRELNFCEKFKKKSAGGWVGGGDGMGSGFGGGGVRVDVNREVKFL